MLHAHNPDLDVRCITDSGSMYPYSVHTHNCDPHLIEYAAFEVIFFTNTSIKKLHLSKKTAKKLNCCCEISNLSRTTLLFFLVAVATISYLRVSLRNKKKNQLKQIK